MMAVESVVLAVLAAAVGLAGGLYYGERRVSDLLARIATQAGVRVTAGPRAAVYDPLTDDEYATDRVMATEIEQVTDRIVSEGYSREVARAEAERLVSEFHGGSLT
jgi:hypothetical protein